MHFNFIVISTLVVLFSYDAQGNPPRDARDIHNQEIVGQASNIITSKLLKGSVENNKNSVFSPFGYASILTILEEGSSDDTSYDIKTLLKHPNDRALVRKAYRSVLSHLQGLDPEVAPQFRTWFYIYKNNTVEDSFKDVITKDFYVTVKDVEPYNPDESKMDEEIELPNAKSVEEHGSVKSTIVQAKPNSKPTNSKDIIQFDAYKMEAGPVDETRIDAQKDASKFDEVVEDRQYVEVPAIKNEMQQEKETGKLDDAKLPMKEEQNIKKSVKPSVPIKQNEEMEIMQAVESRSGKAFAGKYGEGVSIISGNSIVGEKKDYKEGDKYQYEPKMLLFNGLYYHGSWAIPFQHLRDDSVENIFYSMNNEKIPIKMMRGRGYFRTGKIPKYDSEAIELPYDNIRYSMLVIMPNGSDGMETLINEFNSNSIREISNDLKQELINVGLPKFEVQTTGGAEKVLAKEGLASIFTSKANFNGISKSHKLRVGELQQHVILSVDETSSSENSLIGTNALRSTGPFANQRSIVINRPFLFFIRDRIDDVTIIAGKIISLEAFAMDEPEIPL